MSIRFCESAKTFTIETRGSTYQMKIGRFGFLQHLYYGKKISGADNLSYLVYLADHGFSGNPPEAGNHERNYSADALPLEFSAFGACDFRTPCLAAEFADGARTLDLRYESHQLFPGKPALPGLPAVYAGEDEAESLEITLKDAATELRVRLLYSVLPEKDAVTRSCKVVNGTDGTVKLETVLSCCLDFDSADYDFISFYGRHAFERAPERTHLRHGKTVVDSVRGTSSHQQNPFVILCSPNADEDSGDCYGVSFVYSGNFAATAEVDQYGQTRLTMGINPQGFSWELAPGASFQAPETVLVYSPSGLGQLSRRYHDLIRENVCRGVWKDQRRPVLINNWEATYFGFDDDKLVRIAEDASKLGVEMLVMDDGWFGKRDGDVSGLGDWVVNENKLRGGLDSLCKRVNALGMKLGIWFEPEMVSEDSDLYRAHPDWCFRVPGRGHSRSRFQLVLDLSRKDVEDYLFQSLSAVLRSANLEYVKWDMNRHLTEVWSALLPAHRQGEVYHRYVLGVYSLLERLLEAFPKVLFEGCSGGGGRFDVGMLYYTPQIWTSDNTDAIDRVKIQYGTSFGYPVSAMGAHVSAVPNHQSGRMTPIQTRGVVAMAGTFGYELDTNALSEEDKEQIKLQTAFYKEHYFTINHGDYYRLSNPFDGGDWAAWEFVSKDQSTALAGFVQFRAQANGSAVRLKLRGLEPNARYEVRVGGGGARTLGAETLMNAGVLVAPMHGDYQSLFVELKKTR